MVEAVIYVIFCVLTGLLGIDRRMGFFGTFLLTGFSNGEPWQEGVSFDTGCFVDIDGDNVVGIGDLLVVIEEWGPCPTPCAGDVTSNGTVGIRDLLEVLKHWGPCSTP